LTFEIESIEQKKEKMLTVSRHLRCTKSRVLDLAAHDLLSPPLERQYWRFLDCHKKTLTFEIESIEQKKEKMLTVSRHLRCTKSRVLDLAAHDLLSPPLEQQYWSFLDCHKRTLTFEKGLLNIVAPPL
ncbi:MAG: hypothetical protein O7D30_12045, partial [Rickettsia endosymbiont of Ixodes persulcatus]|nr:hypothetical protein [Rickettsia endosymbiont of Ixodes persulcatus]